MGCAVGAKGGRACLLAEETLVSLCFPLTASVCPSRVHDCVCNWVAEWLGGSMWIMLPSQLRCGDAFGFVSTPSIMQELLAKTPDNRHLHLFIASCHYYLQNYTEAEESALMGPANALQNRILFHVAHKQGDENKLMMHHQKLTDDVQDQLSLASIHYLRSHFQEVRTEEGVCVCGGGEGAVLRRAQRLGLRVALMFWPRTTAVSVGMLWTPSRPQPRLPLPPQPRVDGVCVTPLICQRAAMKLVTESLPAPPPPPACLPGLLSNLPLLGLVHRHLQASAARQPRGPCSQCVRRHVLLQGTGRGDCLRARRCVVAGQGRAGQGLRDRTCALVGLLVHSCLATSSRHASCPAPTAFPPPCSWTTTTCPWRFWQCTCSPSPPVPWR
jgi:hypothetical protein